MERALPNLRDEGVEFVGNMRRVGRGVPRAFDEHLGVAQASGPVRIEVAQDGLMQVQNRASCWRSVSGIG